MTPLILSYVSEISRLIGRLEGIEARPLRPELRRGYRILSVHSSCAIEGNSLSLDQVRTIVAGEQILAPAKDILEIRNANKLYDEAEGLSPHSERDFLKAHQILMAGLVEDAGKYRKGNVGMIKGDKVAHIAPKPALVPQLMQDIFRFIRGSNDLPKIVVACIAHYEIEFIHPFSDGNGRIGRFWQHLILTHDNPVFFLVPIESIIRENQKDYYRTLRLADQSGESTVFIEFALRAILLALNQLWESYHSGPDSAEDRLMIAERKFQKNWFARKDYISLLKGISTATASRDLTQGVTLGHLERQGNQATTRYRFCRSI